MHVLPNLSPPSAFEKMQVKQPDYRKKKREAYRYQLAACGPTVHPALKTISSLGEPHSLHAMRLDLSLAWREIIL